MQQVLFAWIGLTDLKAAEGEPNIGLGPIAKATTCRDFDLLGCSNYQTLSNLDETLGYGKLPWHTRCPHRVAWAWRS